MSVEWICIGLVALFWGGYPLVTRATQYAGALGTLVLGIAALAPVVAAVLWQGDYTRPTAAQLGALVVAGLMQGAGLLAFLRVASGALDASIGIPISDGAMLIVTAVGAIVFFAEPVTGQKLAGLALLVTGIALLRPA